MTIGPEIIPGFSYLCIEIGYTHYLDICTVALRNAAVFPLCPYWPVSGDLAAFPGKMDQRTIRRLKGP